MIILISSLSDFVVFQIRFISVNPLNAETLSAAELHRSLLGGFRSLEEGSIMRDFFLYYRVRVVKVVFPDESKIACRQIVNVSMNYERPLRASREGVVIDRMNINKR